MPTPLQSTSGSPTTSRRPFHSIRPVQRASPLFSVPSQRHTNNRSKALPPLELPSPITHLLPQLTLSPLVPPLLHSSTGRIQNDQPHVPREGHRQPLPEPPAGNSGCNGGAPGKPLPRWSPATPFLLRLHVHHYLRVYLRHQQPRRH